MRLAPAVAAVLGTPLTVDLGQRVIGCFSSTFVGPHPFTATADHPAGQAAAVWMRLTLAARTWQPAQLADWR